MSVTAMSVAHFLVALLFVCMCAFRMLASRTAGDMANTADDIALDAGSPTAAPAEDVDEGCSAGLLVNNMVQGQSG